MEYGTYNIGITCIGSGIGQSIINSLKLSRLPFKTFGIGDNPFAYGSYDCDYQIRTKKIHDDNYIASIIDICKRNKIDLVIPALDDELQLFSKNTKNFQKAGIKTIISGTEFIAACRDKERMNTEFGSIANVFVKNYNKQTIEEAVRTEKLKFPIIAKPRGGSGSQGIEIINSEDDLYKIPENSILQELAIPGKDDPNYDFYLSQIGEKINPQVSEVSIQLVYSNLGKLLGRMSTYNKLKDGIPIEIVSYENKYIWSIVDKLTPAFLKMGLKGPLNIQGRLTDNGFKIFEMNPRFTGITGLRALMGFNEVESCVKEWLGINSGKNQLTFNSNRFGTRQVADKVISLDRNIEIQKLYKKLNNVGSLNRKTVLITGASGYLGQNLIDQLIQQNEFDIWVFGRVKSKTEGLFKEKVEKIIDSGDLQNGRVNLGNVDILLHLGFKRPHGTHQQIAESLKFTNELFTMAVKSQIPAIINISSQSVYGLKNDPPWSEEKTPVAPQMVYAQAKYATELMLESFGKLQNTLKYSSIRLGTLAGGAKGLIEVDLYSKFARQAIERKQIQLIGGRQILERFDIRDAVDAIITMLKTNPEDWKPVYNLSSGQTSTLYDIAVKTINIAFACNGGLKSEIQVENKQVDMKFGMDSSLFFSDMKWKPKYTVEDTIESLIRYFQNE
ncbi:NAD-dependent epimerase/dehydratase family protein [Mariniphaga sp.]|uniref:NAD-dependent epimerase/dehydratase family protein n=1 Tax=Mariniphaga sp. TaxID=1954475 RepID=UPI003566EC02